MCNPPTTPPKNIGNGLEVPLLFVLYRTELRLVSGAWEWWGYPTLLKGLIIKWSSKIVKETQNKQLFFSLVLLTKLWTLYVLYIPSKLLSCFVFCTGDIYCTSVSPRKKESLLCCSSWGFLFSLFGFLSFSPPGPRV